MSYKILLVDDEPQNLKDLYYALNSYNYKVFVASNVKIAVDQMIKHCPDPIIMDWEMTEINGLDAIRIIRANEKEKKHSNYCCNMKNDKHRKSSYGFRIESQRLYS